MITAPRVPIEHAFAGPIDLAPLCPKGTNRDEAAETWRDAFARHLYGPMPDPPLALDVTRHALPGTGAERLALTLTLPMGRMQVDAALWLPDTSGPVPLICGLDFIGPAGILVDAAFPLDPDAVVVARPEHGAPDGKLVATLRGTSAHNWPIPLLTSLGYGVIVSCYGSWTPDHPTACKDRGTCRHIEIDTGAISLWAWAISRLIDAAATLPEIDMTRIAVAGHSRLGKAALWAAAHDYRIGATFASSSGAAGAAPASHPIGETLVELRDRFPHWLGPTADVAHMPVDQHALIALAAPRAVYLAAAEDDLWADPLGSYLALSAASAVWPDAGPYAWPDPRTLWQPGQRIVQGALGFHLRAGGHALLPYDWQRFLAFLNEAH